MSPLACLTGGIGSGPYRERPDHEQPMWICKNKSCQINMISLFYSIASSVDERNILEIIYLCFSKAFHAMPHGIREM